MVKLDPFRGFHCHPMCEVLGEVALVEVGLLHNLTLGYGVLIHVLSDRLGNQHLVPSGKIKADRKFYFKIMERIH